VVFGGYLLLGRGRGAPIQATFTRLTNQEGRESSPSLSPDGAFFVYVKSVDGDADLYLQRGGGGNPINLTPDSAVDDTQPAFSPDGQQIAFRSEREGGGIFVMGATGESVKRVSDFGFNPAWSPDGADLVVATEGVATPGARASRSQLWRIAVATGEKRLVFAGDAVQPNWSPHGDRIAFWSVVPGSAKRVLWTIPAGGDKAVPATGDDFLNWSPVWSPDGRHLYFASDRGGTMNLWRVPIEETSGEVTGPPEPISTPSEWSGFLSLSQDGRRLVYATDDVRSNLERIAFDPARGEATGDLAPVTHGSRAVRFGDVSPDGRWIAFDTAAPQEDLFVVQPDGSGLRQLTNDVHKDRIPRWSANGSRVVFYSNRDGDYEIWAIRPDGSGLEKLAAAQDEPLFNPVGSPDGRWIACSLGYKGAAVIDLAQPPGRRIPRLLPAEKGCRGIFIPAAWAPGGQELAIEFAEPGIGVYSLGARSCARLTERGGSPVWLRDGRTLLYLDGGAIFSLDRRTRQTREVLAPPRDSTFLGLSASPDRRTLYVVRAVDEGDVWMATMR
jgi:Tol biopolymer transport system component